MSDLRGALVAWRFDGVGHGTSIHVAGTSSALLKEIRPSIISTVDQLFQQHWEVINLQARDLIDGPFADSDPPDDGWDAQSVSKLFLHLLERRATELAGGLGTESILGEWYELSQLVSEAWAAEAGDYFVIPVEGSLETLTAAVLSAEESEVFGRSEAKWLVRVRRLVERSDWANDLAVRKELWALFEEFDVRHTSI